MVYKVVNKLCPESLWDMYEQRCNLSSYNTRNDRDLHISKVNLEHRRKGYNRLGTGSVDGSSVLIGWCNLHDAGCIMQVVGHVLWPRAAWLYHGATFLIAISFLVSRGLVSNLNNRCQNMLT